jgi:hypothetical protein
MMRKKLTPRGHDEEVSSHEEEVGSHDEEVTDTA